jgi:Zn finger protein HypA/HybF involved in hydrogenase expression
MEFIFICPKRNMTFKSADFHITENRGVIENASGNKILDAKIELNASCPFCGEKHVYLANELSCPFEIQKSISGSKSENR